MVRNPDDKVTITNGKETLSCTVRAYEVIYQRHGYKEVKEDKEVKVKPTTRRKNG